jgi:hypothetical protein
MLFPDPAKRFFIMTDYCSEGISAVISQFAEDGEHPIAYWSQANKGAARNLQATVGECMAAVQGIKYFRCYLLGKNFTLLTDHSALRWLFNHKGDNTQLLQWSLVLQEYYPFDIDWRPGKQHGNADCLSRYPLLYLRTGELPGDKHLRRKIVAESAHLTIYNEILYHIWLPRSMVPDILRQAHEAGHFRPWKTLRLLKDRCYWWNMAAEVL